MGQVKIQIKHGSNTKCIKANMGQIQIQIWVKFKSFGELSQAEIVLCARHQCSLECTLKCFSGCSEIEILHKYKQLGKQIPKKGNIQKTITGLFGIFPKWTPSPGIGYLFLMHIQLPLLQPDLFRSRSNGFLNKQIH